MMNNDSANANAEIPEQAQTTPSAAPDFLSQAHDAAIANYDRLKSRVNYTAEAMKQLQGLQRMGSAITSGDVIDSAGELLSHGAQSPHDLAVMLSDLPEQPEALQQWVKEKIGALGQGQQRLQMGTSLARHEQGTFGLLQLLHHSLGGKHAA